MVDCWNVIPEGGGGPDDVRISIVVKKVKMGERRLAPGPLQYINRYISGNIRDNSPGTSD